MIYSEIILICIVVPLFLAIYFISDNAKGFVGSFIVGMIICLVSAYISGYVEYVLAFDHDWMAIYITPIIEEIMKAIPLLMLMFIFEPDNKTMILIAVGLGAGFATFENCCYLLENGADSFWYVIIRGVCVGVMHIVSMLILSYGMILSKKFNAVTIPAIFGALSFSMIYHSLYNLLVSIPGVSSIIGYCVPLATAILLYIPYHTLRKEIT